MIIRDKRFAKFILSPTSRLFYYNDKKRILSKIPTKQNNQNKFRPFSIALSITIVVVLIIISNNNYFLIAQDDNNLSSTTRKSELIFESQALESIPKDRICQANSTNNQVEIINLV